MYTIVYIKKYKADTLVYQTGDEVENTKQVMDIQEWVDYYKLVEDSDSVPYDIVHYHIKNEGLGD